jgi:hypothetical protein
MVQVGALCDYVRKGGVINLAALIGFATRPEVSHAPLISINIFEDGYQIIRDGHHRAVAIKMAGRNYLRDSEYETEEYTYQEWNEYNYDEGWMTPHNPHTHTRKPDLADWKNRVVDTHQYQSPDHARHLVLTGRDSYATMKKTDTIEHLTKMAYDYLAIGGI